MFDAVASYLTNEQREIVSRAARGFARLETATLPRALIHADLTKGNVLADGTGRVYLIDFAVAGRHPRIQELAVVAANLTHEAAEPLPERAQTIANMYDDANPRARLTAAEYAALSVFVFAAAAMEFLGAIRARHLDGDDRPEIVYLIDLGLAGLADSSGTGGLQRCEP